jgi:DNA primase
MRRTGIKSAPTARAERFETDRLRSIPIAEVAQTLGLDLRRDRAMCFNGHDRQTPSFVINRKQNNWKCYGCGEFGDAITLAGRVLGIDFKAACRWLSAQYALDAAARTPPPNLVRRAGGVAVSKPPGHDYPTTDTAADPELYTWLVARCGAVTEPPGVRYLAEHGISAATASAFGVVELTDTSRAYLAMVERWGADRVKKSGLSGSRPALMWSGYSVVFPFREGPSTTYLQVRCLSGTRKFVGPMGVPKPMFNHARLKTLAPNETIHICEGIPDTIALEGRGLHAVGVLGANSFRIEWVDELLPFDLVGVPDGDSGGTRFRESLSRAFHARSKSIRFVVPPEGMDAGDVISRIADE